MTNYISPKRFNIVLNSQQVSASSSGNPNDCTYEFNWTNIPRGKYKMSFSYKGQNNSDFVSNDSPQIFLSLGTVPSVYQASNANGSVVSNWIGSLHAETHAATEIVFFANLTDNPDVYYDHLPTSGPIRVQVYRANFTSLFTTITTNQNLANYVMCLSFEQVGKVDGYGI
jgi:hypothetical protein